jgi:cell division cycle protein 37
MVDYSKWKDIEVSDDEDDTHPNIDTGSLFRWRHQARVEKMAELEQTKREIETKKKALEEEKRKVETQSATSKLEKLKVEEDELKKTEEEVKKKERLMPWNVDTLSKPGFEKTIINKAKPKQDLSHLSEEEKEELYRKFVTDNESNIKKFGMLAKWDDCKQFLLENPNLCCEDTANYLAIWCLNLEMEEKSTLADHISKQVVAMQYILELAKTLECDPRSCISAFFTRIQKAEKEYQDAFADELKSFRARIKDRAKVKMAKIMEEIEEEEKQKRIAGAPGGLDPQDVFESLPKEMQECFEKRDLPALQELITKMDENDARYHMKRCVDSGLWIPDAKSAQLLADKGADGTEPAEEIYDELQPIGAAGGSS